MILLWALVIGLVIGFLRHGNLGNLARLKLNGVWLIFAALLIQVLIFPLGPNGPIVRSGTAILHFVSYALLIGFIGLNRKRFGILVMGIGLLLNILAISANGGYMPASAAALRHAGMEQTAIALEQELHHGNTVLMSKDTRLNLLGDRFSVPATVPLATAFSIGDILLALGVIIFLATEMPRGKESFSD